MNFIVHINTAQKEEEGSVNIAFESVHKRKENKY